MSKTHSQQRTNLVSSLTSPFYRVLLILIILISTVGIPTGAVLADPNLPLPRMPICGDQDGSEAPLVFRCSEFVPSVDVATYEVPGTVERDFIFDFIYRQADLNNELGMFKVDNSLGAIDGLLPGDPGYLAAALGRAEIIFPSGSTAFTPDVTFELQGEDIYTFFIIQGNTLTNFLINNPTNALNRRPLAFFSLDALNPDGVDHFVGFHNAANDFSQFGFEDLTGGGDNDFDDVVYTISPPLRPEPPQSVEPPLILVHGWHGLPPFLSSYTDTCRDIQGNYLAPYRITNVNELPSFNDFGGFAANLFNDGWDVWIAHVETSPAGTGTPPIEYNAKCLQSQIAVVREQTGAAKVRLLAHSMGGLVGRAYIENDSLYRDDVLQLITFGTPHSGTPYGLIFCLNNLLLPADRRDYAACQFSLGPQGIGVFNNTYSSRREGVIYNFIGGNRTPFGAGPVLRYFGTEGPNDGVVGAQSGIGRIFFPFGPIVNFVDVGEQGTRHLFDASHSGFGPSYSDLEFAQFPLPQFDWKNWRVNWRPYVAEVSEWFPSYFALDVGDEVSRTLSYECTLYLLDIHSVGHTNNPRGSCPPEAMLASQNMEAQTQDPAVVAQIPVISGDIPAGQNVTHMMPVDAGSFVEFNLSWDEGDLEFTIINPSGTIIDPEYAASHPDEVTYQANSDPASPLFASYYFISPLTGEYQIQVTNAGSNDTSYSVNAWLASERTLKVETDQAFYTAGSNATITAILQNTGLGLTGATVEANINHPNRLSDTIPLVDQGGGIYQGNYTVPNTPGYMGLSVVAHGVDQGTEYARQRDELFAITPSTVQFTGVNSEIPLDNDGDGKYEALILEVGLNTAQVGNYLISGDLVSGDLVVAHNVRSFTLATPGVNAVSLVFDGDDIRETAIDGPYTLTNLTIANELDPGLPAIWQATNVWSTENYSYTQFGTHPCYRLTLSHTGSGGDPTASPAKSRGCAPGEYVPGEVIDLTASASDNWQPAGWTGTLNDSSTESFNAAIMPAGNHSVSVNYVRVANPEYILYMTENQGTLRRVDQDTGTSAPIGNIGTNSIDGLSNRPGDTTHIYGVYTSGIDNSGLARINTLTGETSLLPVFDAPTLGMIRPVATAISISPDSPDIAVVAGADAGNARHYYLWKVDVDTGAVLGAAIPTAEWVLELAYNLDGSTLYGADAEGQLVTVDIATGNITLVGDPGLSNFIEGLAFRPSDGELFAIDAFDQDRLVRLDPTDGSLIQVIGGLGFAGPYGLAFIPGYKLDISTSGNGTGRVTSAPAGIDCGSVCSYAFNANAEVTLTTIASAGSTFTGWSGGDCAGTNPCTVAMSAAISITADFTTTNVEVYIGGLRRAGYNIPPHESTRDRFAGVSSGPVQVRNTEDMPMIAAQRVIYKVNGANTSYSEMMGLPDFQLDNLYWLPWYNNIGLDTQLRIANVSDQEAAVHISIGGEAMVGSPFTLEPGESTRKSFPAVNSGPVKVESDQNLVVAERVIYKVRGGNVSFTEMMAMPNNQLDTTYWLPWYNNVGLDTQLRIANASDQEATVHIYIGGQEMTGSPFTLVPGASTRRRFPGINSGPVKIESDQTIVAAERVIYKVKGVNTSFSEMMALPEGQLNTTYWLPWYNNVGLDTQLRIANVSNEEATVHVYIGGEEMVGSPFAVAPGAGIRRRFPDVNSGPVKIESDQTIVAAERVIYKVNGINTSFSELMSLPHSLLGSMFWFPWYNNIHLDTQLRFGVP